MPSRSKSSKSISFIFALALVLAPFGASSTFAQAVDVPESSDRDLDTPVDETPSPPPVQTIKPGKDRAKTYFQKRKPSSRAPAAVDAAAGPAPRYLAIYLGRMFADQSYRWGKHDQSEIGNLNAGVTYRLGEWVNSMDLGLRIDYTSYTLEGGSARKLSPGVIVTFPDANSQFPLYFGGGLGAGIFIKQLSNESVLSLDYSLLAGVRFLNVINNIGFMAEAGVKNHMFLLSDGQYNGVFFTLGAVFAF
jgi:hypothetical protein